MLKIGRLDLLGSVSMALFIFILYWYWHELDQVTCFVAAGLTFTITFIVFLMNANTQIDYKAVQEKQITDEEDRQIGEVKTDEKGKIEFEAFLRIWKVCSLHINTFFEERKAELT